LQENFLDFNAQKV